MSRGTDGGSSTQCVVIGGGVMGCAIAWRLAQAGVRTTVLERAIPGAEASSAAGGILAAQEEARGRSPLIDMCLASRDRFAGLAAELVEATGVDIGYRVNGILSVAFTEQEERDLEARYAWMRETPLPLERLSAREAIEREPALNPAIRSALLFPRDGQVEPRSYMRALTLAAAQAGVEFITGCYVRRIVVAAGRVRGVEIESGLLECDRVILAAGSWSSLVEGTGLPSATIRPVRGQMVRLETRPAALRGTLVSPRGAYVVGRADGSVLMGSTVEEVGFRKEVTAAGLHAILEGGLELAPSLGEAPIMETWSNFRPRTPDGLPILGPSAVGGLLFATGHYRYGILLSALTADLLAELVTTERSSFPLTPFLVSRFA